MDSRESLNTLVIYNEVEHWKGCVNLHKLYQHITHPYPTFQYLKLLLLMFSDCSSPEDDDVVKIDLATTPQSLSTSSNSRTNSFILNASALAFSRQNKDVLHNRWSPVLNQRTSWISRTIPCTYPHALASCLGFKAPLIPNHLNACVTSHSTPLYPVLLTITGPSSPTSVWRLHHKSYARCVININKFFKTTSQKGC
eukprot:Blabericola_migrator_1__2962@NODE_1856_length_3655_cov_6_386009_g1187_i0_p3_GENE_NODE_1856_length_3655_cov_6_386009_g1187_i0NODE_1856_length_3655_cov_6_386009_g1187_i0_p3_ORF_typecomplete_len197_score8_54Homeobox_KN/PF05920_11/0_19_NODE_1856_length_3655_cov_6_386009_g1187_i0337927